MKFHSRKIHLSVLLFTLLLLFSSSTFVAAEESGVADLETLLREAVSLMVENHPLLISQRSLLATSESVSLPDRRLPVSVTLSSDIGAGISDGDFKVAPSARLGVSVPLTDPDRAIEDIQTELAWARLLEDDNQALQNLIEELTTNLVAEIEQLINLQQQYSGYQELVELLKERRVQQQELVQTGVERSDSIWDLDERVTDLKVELARLQSQSILLINKVAYNFGGDEWQEMKVLLEKMINVSEVVQING